MIEMFIMFIKFKLIPIMYIQKCLQLSIINNIKHKLKLKLLVKTNTAMNKYLYEAY